jgi:hypothetical protein
MLPQRIWAGANPTPLTHKEPILRNYISAEKFTNKHLS